MKAPLLVCPTLLRLHGAQWSLQGGRCADCGEPSFPAAGGCTRCSGTRIEPFDLGHRGRLWSWTVQGFCPKPPYDGPAGDDFRPYGVGYVEMDCGLKVESRLTLADPARLHIGMAMALCLDPYRADEQGRPLHTYAFRPAADDEAASP